MGALTAFLFFLCLTASSRNERRRQAKEDAAGYVESYPHLFYLLTVTILPIVVSSAIYNCSNVVDNYLFGQGMDRLGFAEDAIATSWGVLGQYQLLFNIPVAVSNALSSSLIPSLTRAVASHNRRDKLDRIATSIRFSLLIAVPAAVGITVLAEPVCNLLFISEDNSLLIRLSMVGSLAVVFYSLSTVTNAVLQGLNHMDAPIRHALAALLIHVAVLECLLLVFQMGIYSVVFANIVFALTMCLLNGWFDTQVCKIPAGIQKDLPSSNTLLFPYGSGGVGRIAPYVYAPPCRLGERASWHGYGGFPICSCGNTGLCHSVGEAESGGEGGAETDAGRSPSGRAFRQIMVTIAGFGCGMNDIAKIQKEVRSK